uniref:uncharacterized protein LOC132691327 n=1 Tax=Panthera onca TaxID=9690 RepID=UPI0029554F7E|nr:uncharacterized protein LOC132691327 [Panthera onca]
MWVLWLNSKVSPASPDPPLLKPRPHRRARAWGAGRGTKPEKGGGREERLVHAPHSLRVREQRAPAARVAIFSPSVCLSAVGFVRLQRRPSAPRHRLGPKPPSACRGSVPESPGPAGPSCGPGPIVRRSVCPEAGPRDAARRGAPRLRIQITGIRASLLCSVGTAPELEVGVHPLFLKLGFHLLFLFFSPMLKSVVCPESCNLTPVGEQGQC